MALPQIFNSPEEYFVKVLSFFKEYDWIYNYPNTHILVNKVFDNFPSEWTYNFKNMTTEEFINLPLGVVGESWPDDLKSLIGTIQSLKPTSDYIDSGKELYNFPSNCRLSVKKRHEILSLATLIHNNCLGHNIEIIIDVGAGIGYLSQLLHEKYKYKVLGIEGSEKNVTAALRYQKNFYPQSKDFVKYVKHFITAESSEFLHGALVENFQNCENVCIVGLHACADLSVTILKTFQELDFVSNLIIMPCCYHRLHYYEENGREKFTNFPASNLLKTIFVDAEAETFLRRPFLRLASQQTHSSWLTVSQLEIDRQTRSCLFRAILQEIAEEENCAVSRLKRKSGKIKSDLTDIEDYVENLKHTHVLKGPGNLLIDDPIFKGKFFEKWNAHKENCCLIKALTAFQVSIQSICENVVLLDRVQFLSEKGIQCYVGKVTNDRISPRCYALVAAKR